MRLAAPLSDLTEKAWDAQLFGSKRGLATSLGWTLAYHTLRSKGSQPGFPDRVIVRERVIFAELKREGGKPTERQVVWLDGLAAAGAEVYLWRPSDLDEIGRVLPRRWTFFPIGAHMWGSPDAGPLMFYADEPLLRSGSDDPWTPGSLWISGRGRADS